MGLAEFIRRWPLRALYRRWRERHQHPFNFAVHLLGIPLAVSGVVLLCVLPWEQWYWGNWHGENDRPGKRRFLRYIVRSVGPNRSERRKQTQLSLSQRASMLGVSL